MTELHVRLKQQQHHAHTPHSVPGMSAFVRRQPARTVDLGTRPGLHGQVLISSGLAGIDRLLGGGLPLGCVLLVIEDAHSQQHLNLLRCFLAEGVCCKHSLALLTAQQLDADGLAALLPDQAKPSGSSGSTEAGSGGAATGGPRSSMQAAAAGAQPPAPAASGAPDDGLKIAWQYRKYINNSTQQQSARASSSAAPKQPSSGGSSSSSASAAAKAVAAGIGREWCHQFDLSKGLSREQLAASKLQLHCCCPSTLGQPGAHNEQQQQQQQQGDRGSTPMQAVQAAAAAAQAFLSLFQPKGAIPVPSRDPASIGRLVVRSLGAPEWWPDMAAGAAAAAPGSQRSSSSSWARLEAAMLTAVAQIRLAVQDASAAAFITCPAGLFSASFQAQLQHLADAVLCVQALADNTDLYRLLPDANSACALLEVRRLPCLGLMRQRHVEDALHVIRNKRRGISVGVLDLVPLEAAAAAGGGGGGGGGGAGGDASGAARARDAKKPVVAQLCGGPGGGGASGGGGLLEF